MSDNLITVEHVSKRYTDKLALDDVSLSIPEGTIYGLLGPNGAGKTTLIRMLNHITVPDSGRILFAGKELTAGDTTNIGYLPEERGLYKKMKVGEQAIFFAGLKGMRKRDAELALKGWFDKFEITSWWNKRVDELSKGMAQKLQFITTVIHRPKLLIFDEPFSGFDPVNANLLKNEILQLRDQGATVIFSTHNMNSVEEICDDITLINASKNVLSGKVKDIRKEFCKDKYQITIAESPSEQLKEWLDKATLGYSVSPLQEGASELEVHIRPDIATRELISMINTHSTMLSFREAMTSMNDIFIDAVTRNRNDK